MRSLPAGAEALWLDACLAERRAWPGPAPIPPISLPEDAAPALRVEIATWLLRRGAAEPAAALLGKLPDAALDDAAWLLRARLLILAGAVERLDPLAAAAIAAAPHSNLLARLRLTASVLKGDLAPLGVAALPAESPPADLPIVQYWDAEQPPADVAAVMEGWRAAHPGLRHLAFHRATARAYLAEHYGEQGAAAFDACPHPAVESDLLRFAVLAREGGIWADVDERCRRPWDGLLALVPPRGLIVAFSDELPFYVHTFLLAARPANPIMVRALGGAMRALLRQRPGVRLPVWSATGPGLLTRLIVADPARARLMSQGLLRHLSGGAGDLAYKLDRAADWRPD
jgi:hypothetical protein